MAIVKFLWNGFRATGLLVFLMVLIGAVLFVSSVAQLLARDGSLAPAGTLHSGI